MPSKYSYLNSEEKLKKLKELREQLEELKANMNVDEMLEAREREIWEEPLAHLKKTNSDAYEFPLGEMLFAGFILLMLFLIFGIFG